MHACRARVFLHVADETNAFSCDRADQPLILAGVANRMTGSGNSAGQGGIGNIPTVPNVLDQIVLADDTLAILEEILKKIENLRFDGDQIVAVPQLPPIDI